MNPGRIIARLARARRRLMLLDFKDREKVLTASVLDRLLAGYYRLRRRGRGGGDRTKGS